MSDHSSELEKEKMIGEIKNVFLLVGSESPLGRTPNQYISYNLIFTDGALFGEQLKAPGAIQEGGFPAVGFIGHGKIEDIGPTLAKSTVAEGAAYTPDSSNRIDIRMDYKDIKRLTLRNAEIRFSMLAKIGSIDCMMLDIEAGFLDVKGGKFYISKAVSDDVAKLIKKTPVSDRLAIK